MKEKIIEVELGVGLNQIFPEKIKIVIQKEDETNEETVNTNKDGKEG